MKKTRMIWIGTLLCLLLTACQPAPGEPANSDTDSTADTSVSQSGNPVEDGTNVGNDIASISDANMELVRSVNGTAIEETITTADGKQILLNAQVNTESVETIQQYQYEVLPVTDELRETLFTTFFGARASEAIYDQRNDVWELHNSEAIGDYYLYEHTIAMAGESVPGEEIFTLGYWGMAQAMGDSFSSAVAVSVFLLIVLNLGIIYWLSRHNPAANPQSK